jgi:hypothetical protein
VNVAVCIGKHCSHRPESAQLVSMLSVICDPVEVRCLGICDGPVVAVTFGDSPDDVLVLRTIRKPKHRHAVERLIIEGKRPKTLKKRIVTGKKRRKSLARLHSNLDRAARTSR